MKYIFFLFTLFSCTPFLNAQVASYQTVENISYVEDSASPYAKSQCKLDIHYPVSGENRPVVIWFHGGGLTGGKKEIPAFLKEKDLVVVGVGYQFSPEVKVEEIIKDAAKATTFVMQNIHKYRGDTNQIFISGHSAGGYLALMITLNKKYLADEGQDADKIAGSIPFSAQTITHFTARKEQGIDEKQPTIDELAPLFWVRNDAPPIVLLSGDPELELLGRYEENAYLHRMLSIVGHKDHKLVAFQGYDHGMVYPGLPVLVNEIKRLVKERK